MHIYICVCVGLEKHIENVYVLYCCHIALLHMDHSVFFRHAWMYVGRKSCVGVPGVWQWRRVCQVMNEVCVRMTAASMCFV